MASNVRQSVRRKWLRPLAARCGRNSYGLLNELLTCVIYSGGVAERTGQLLALDELCRRLADRWLVVTGLSVTSNSCVFAARVLRVVAERQKVPFRVMACTTSIHTELPDVDNPPLMLDPADLSVVEPGLWRGTLWCYLAPVWTQLDYARSEG
jgi:hypothetical protein